MRANLKFAARMLRRNPGFTAVAVLTLALGIGANTAIFSLVYAVLLRPLPFAHPEQLVTVKDDLLGPGIRDLAISQPQLQDYQERSGVFDQITAIWPISANLTGSDRPERVEALAVSPNYFTILGVRAQIGRVFGPQDRADGFAEGMILSDGLWRRLYGGDPHILGRKLRLDNDLYTIVGVMPAGFRHPGPTIQDQVEAWITAGFTAAPFPVPPNRGARMIPGAIGRLKPGLTLAQAQSKLDAFAAALSREYPTFYPAAMKWTPRLNLLQEDLTGHLRSTLWLVFGAVVGVLLICCVSLANLMVAKAIGRQREIAVRRALGAPWSSIIRQLMVESLVISTMGGLAGWLLVLWATPLLPRIVPMALPVADVGVNGGVMLFAAAISLVTGMVFGLAPAVPMVQSNIVGSLKEGVRGSSVGAGHKRLRSVLVACEIAFSLMLMAGAGLLLHSFWNLRHLNPGFNPDNVLVANIWLPAPNDPAASVYRNVPRRRAFVRDVLRRVRALPGVEAAAMGAGNSTPLTGFNPQPFQPEGSNLPPGEQPVAEAASVSPDFFRALGIRLVRGRAFTEADESTNICVIVDETLAARYWPKQDAVGKRIRLGNQFAEIVGVVGNIKSETFEKPDGPHLYFSIYQRSNLAMTVFLRTGGSPLSLGEAVRREVQSVDRDLPVFGIRSMQEIVARSLAQRRFQLEMVGAFALVALALAMMGIYGVTAFWVGQRTQEIGIRIALGAAGRDVVGMVLKQGLTLTIWGIAAGLAGAIPLASLLRSLLFGMGPFDFWTFAGITGLLLAAAMTACYLPARRATSVDPVVALRAE